MSKIETVRSRKKFNFPTVCGVAKLKNPDEDGLQISQNIFFILGISVQNQNKSFSVAKNKNVFFGDLQTFAIMTKIKWMDGDGMQISK
jgi:hypothetical protein